MRDSSTKEKFFFQNQDILLTYEFFSCNTVISVPVRSGFASLRSVNIGYNLSRSEI